MTVSLKELVERYISERDLSPLYVAQLRHRINALSIHMGEWSIRKNAKVPVQDINNWLSGLHASPSTVKNYRACVLVVLNYAADLGLIEYVHPRRIRRVKIPAPLVNAWTVQEVGRLIDTAQGSWRLYCRIGYETGLRRADILALPWISSETFTVREQKTGRVVVKVVRQETVDLWDTLGGFHFPTQGWYWFRYARQLVKQAGLHGTLSKQLRRTHATHCPGGLQHADPGMLKFYVDQAQTKKAGLPPECFSDNSPR